MFNSIFFFYLNINEYVKFVAYKYQIKSNVKWLLTHGYFTRVCMMRPRHANVILDKIKVARLFSHALKQLP